MFAFIVIVKLLFIFYRSSQSLGFIFLIADDYLKCSETNTMKMETHKKKKTT